MSRRLVDYPLFKKAFGFTHQDIVITGMGTGVPFICILSWVVTGWFLPNAPISSKSKTLKMNFLLSLLTCVVAFVLMVFIWIPSLIRPFSVEFDFAAFGIPNLPYESCTSFYGWLIVIVAIALALQSLTNQFSGVLHRILIPPRSKA